MQITQPITTVTWYGPTLPLGQAPWKGYTSVVRLVNGTGYSNFVQSNGINSLTQVVAGQVLIVESTAASIQNGGYALDNGTAPTNAVRLRATFAAGQTTGFSLPLGLVTAEEAGLYVLDSNNSPTGLGPLTYQKNGSAVSLSTTAGVPLVVGDVLTILGTTQAGTQGYLTLIKQ